MIMNRKWINIVLFLLVFLIKPFDYSAAQGDSLIIDFRCNVLLDSIYQRMETYHISMKTENGTFNSYPSMSDRTDDINYMYIPDILSTGIDAINKNELHFFLVTDSCMSEKIHYTIDSARSSRNNLIINSFYSESYYVNYPSAICEYAENVIPESDLPVKDILFSNANGLSIDSTGVISPQKSKAGTYTINLNSKYCLKSKNIPVSVIPKPEINISESYQCDRTRLQLQANNVINPLIRWSDSTTASEKEVFEPTALRVVVADQYGCFNTDSIQVEVRKLALKSPVINKEEADCWIDGKIAIQSLTVENNVGDYTLHLRNNVNNVLIDRMDEVPEGEYSLQVVDSRNCFIESPEKITVIQKCLEDYPVFTPNSDGIEDQYFIPYKGKVKIYSSDNKLVKELESPVYWDGSDREGNILPMGNYVMITDQGRPVNITIVR